MKSVPVDRPCIICWETIVPETNENLCHECGDKLAEVARLAALCASFSRKNPSVSLRNNPHFAPAERAHVNLLGAVNWECPACMYVMPQLNEHNKSECCDAPISIDRSAE